MTEAERRLLVALATLFAPDRVDVFKQTPESNELREALDDVLEESGQSL